VGAFPDGQSALLLVAACPRHVVAARRDTWRYLVAAFLITDEVKAKSA
jgi:hypothetical protein